MKITKSQLRKIISEEVKIIIESSLSFSKVFKVASKAIQSGRLATDTAISGLFRAGLNLTIDEVEDRSMQNVLGLSALESGLVGLAIGVPMLFFSEYSNAQKGDEMARYMSKSLRRPVEMKDVLDPRDPSNRAKIINKGGSLKSNPILYLSSQKNTNVAAKLYSDKIISTDVFKTVQEIHNEKIKAIRKISDIKNHSSNNKLQA